jgi:hypothetical protein
MSLLATNLPSEHDPGVSCSLQNVKNFFQSPREANFVCDRCFQRALDFGRMDRHTRKVRLGSRHAVGSAQREHRRGSRAP